MGKYEIVKSVFSKVGDIAKTSDFLAEGLSTFDVADICNKGKIIRIRNGYYHLPETNDISDEKFLSIFLPEGIVCVESALFHYGYIDFVPREWSMAVPRSYSRNVKNINEVRVKAYYINDNYIDLGKVSGTFNGVMLPVYNRERCICDCFKYRTKLDTELFCKALNSYARDSEKNLGLLSEYAKKMRVYTRLMSVMEVLLNG